MHFLLLGLTGTLAACNSLGQTPTVTPAPIIATAAVTVSITQPAPTRASTSVATVTVAPITPRAPVTPTADVVIDRNAILAHRLIAVRVGQTLAVANMGESTVWQVSFSPNNLIALTPAEKMNSPGPSGWLFKATQPGEAEIVLTSTVSGRCDATPCPPPMPQQFTITLKIEP